MQFELGYWLAREAHEDRADRVIAFSATCLVAPLDTDIALAAAALSGHHRLATADAIIYATARAAGADLLTCDAHFEGLADVILVPKQSA